MKSDDLIPLLGLTLKDPLVKALLKTCKITQEPRLQSGDSTAIVKNPKLGLEVTFTDAEEIGGSSKRYPEGALVLSNIRMYNDGTRPFQRFSGELPHGIEFSFDLKAAQKKLGAGTRHKIFAIHYWKFKTHLVVIRFDKAFQHIIEMSLQLPGIGG